MAATIIVEDGTRVTGANSYVTVAELTTYADERGVTISAAEEEDLLIQAMDYLESLDYIGYRYTEDQALSWPRSDAKKYKIYWYDTNEIPQDLKDAQCEIALAIDAGNSPSANLERATKREKVGDLEVEYMDSANSSVIVRKINNKLKDLLVNGLAGASFIVGKA